MRRGRGRGTTTTGVFLFYNMTLIDTHTHLESFAERGEVAAVLERAAAVGLAGIGLQAGGALIVDKAAVAARADALGLFVTGVPL